MAMRMSGVIDTRLVSGAVTAFVLGCGGDTRVGPPPVIEGYYELRQVDGEDLPIVVSDNGTSTVEMVSGDVELEDGTWISRTDFRITTPSGVSTDSQSGSGTWALDGDTIRFVAFAQAVGVVRGDTLRVIRRANGEENVFLYLR